MMNKAEEYTQDQITDAEKLCQLIQDIPEPRRRLCTILMKVYMDGVETGETLRKKEMG